MKILLIHPPVREEDVPKHIPYGVGMLASIAEQYGHAVGIMDLNAQRPSLDAVRMDIAMMHWDIIGVSGLSSQYKYIKSLLPVIKEIHPDTTLIAGGGFVSSLPEEVMTWLPQIDIAALGEAEETFPELLDQVDSQNWHKVKGIIYREDSRLIRTEPRPLIKNLDDLPYPAYHLLPLDVYFANSQLVLGPYAATCKKRIDAIWERGCPRQCYFCDHQLKSAYDMERIYGKKFKGEPVFRFNTAKYAVEQIVYLRVKFGVDFISILDENMCSFRQRVFEFCDEFEKADLVGAVRFGLLGDVAAVTPEMLRRLKEVGCDYISYGGESASDRMLKTMKKYTTVKQMQEAIDHTLTVGIQPQMTFVTGFPEESVEDVLETVRFFKRNNMKVKPFILTPYPGTEVFKRERKRIEAYYGGDLEKFLLELDDATDISANISPWNDLELLGIQQLMYMNDEERIKKWAESESLAIFFDVDGTLDMFGGPITKQDIALCTTFAPHVLMGIVSIRDNPLQTKSIYETYGLSNPAYPYKSKFDALVKLKEQSPFAPRHFYYVGDKESDRVVANQAGWLFLTPHAFKDWLKQGRQKPTYVMPIVTPNVGVQTLHEQFGVSPNLPTFKREEEDFRHEPATS